MKEQIVLEVSSKHKVLRTVLFAAAFVIAIASFAIALSSLGRKTPGWQKAVAAPDADVPNYGKGIIVYTYMEGSSSEIRDNLATFNKIYSDNLKRIYRLLDAENVYDGYVNIAYLNSHLGEQIYVPDELFEVLKDAYEKTRSGGYSIFAGPLYRARETLANTEDFDAQYEEQRLSAMEEAISDLSGFTFDILPGNVVCLDVPESYRALLNNLECSDPIIDLGEMQYSYELTLLEKILKVNNYVNCLFYIEQ